MGNLVNHVLLWTLIFAITPSFALAQWILVDATDHQDVIPVIETLDQTHKGLGFAENAMTELNQGGVDVAVLGMDRIAKLAPQLEFLRDPFVILDQKHIAKLRLDPELLHDASEPLSPFDLRLVGMVYLGQWGIVSNRDHFDGADIKPDMVRHLRLAVGRDLSDMRSVRGLGMVPIPMTQEQFEAALSMSAVDAIAQSNLAIAGDTCTQWIPQLYKTSFAFLAVKASRWTALTSDAREAEMTKIQAFIEDLEKVIQDQENSVVQKHTEQGCEMVKVDIGAFKSFTRQPAPDPDQPMTWTDHLYQKVIELGG